MSKEEGFPFYLNGFGLVVHDNAAFLGEVVFAPDVMIPSKEVNGNAHIGEFRQLAQETCVAFGNNILVLEPEIEQVAQNVNTLGLCLYLVEETAQVLLLLPGVLRCATPQMCITYEKSFLH